MLLETKTKFIMGDENGVTCTNKRNMLRAVLLVFVFLVIIVSFIGRDYERRRPQTFAYVKYGDRWVRADTLTRVMYDPKLGPLLYPNGKPILYNGKFPWQWTSNLLDSAGYYRCFQFILKIWYINWMKMDNIFSSFYS